MRIGNPLLALFPPATKAAGHGRAPLATRGRSSFGQLVRGKGEGQTATKPPKRRADPDVPAVDRTLAQTAAWSPLTGAQPPAAPPAAAETQARRSLEDLLPALVRRIAWSGDARRGTVRLELGAGALSGATLIVHADDGRVKVELRAPQGADPAEWKTRIEGRLAARGIDVEGVEVE
jgi:hypothetical protein